MAVCAPGQELALSTLIRAYFSYDPKNEYLLLNQFPYCSPPQTLKELFPELDPEEQLSSQCCILRLLQRNDVLRPLTVRPAITKDHDDLVAIFEQQNTNLTERFGDFFLFQIINDAQAHPDQKLALVGLDYEINSDEIQKPACFLYAEKYDQFADDQHSEDAEMYSNMLATHQLDKYDISSIGTDKIAFVRATACSPQAESRSAQMVEFLFDQWKDIDILILCLPSSSSCMNM